MEKEKRKRIGHLRDLVRNRGIGLYGHTPAGIHQYIRVDKNAEMRLNRAKAAIDTINQVIKELECS